MDKKIVGFLKACLKNEKSVELAFLFGSSAKNRETEDSDVDVAVYLGDKRKEASIWRKVQKILPKDVDLVLLNDAPATITSNVFKTGIPLTIKNRSLYWNLYLEKSLEAEDFSGFAEDYWKISKRAKSLSPEDKTRLLERLGFLKSEMGEIHLMSKITSEDYERYKSQKRNLERWAENVVNAMIDIGKIILASEKKPMPRTYESALESFGILAGLPKAASEKLSGFARLRNLLAHEYLEVLYERIQEFLEGFPEIYEQIEEFMEKYIESN